MDKDTFWSLIDKARRGDAESVPSSLGPLLEALPEEEIIDFDRHLSECFRDAYRVDLWEVAYIMNGGCSDDGFDYFMGWLVARGRKHFEQALMTPDAAAEDTDPAQEPFECEDMWSVAARAYEAKTGRRDFYDRVKRVSRTIEGDPFDEDTVAERHPAVAEKFGMA